MDKSVRITLNDEIYKKYKIFCVQNDISIIRQTEDLIKNFIDIQHHNKELLKNMDKR